jgi:flagellar assembly protein FliH
MSSKARRLLSSATTVTPFGWGTPTDAVPQLTAGPAEPAVDPEALARLERDAFAKGFNEGERAGLDAAAQRGEAMLQRLTGTLDELASVRVDILRRSEIQMVQLALAIARRVVQREVSLDQELLIAMARVALDRLGEATQITVRLHPDDFNLTGAAQRRMLTGSAVTVVGDARIPRGGCRVESELGVIDAGVDAQLQEIARALLGAESADGVAA